MKLRVSRAEVQFYIQKLERSGYKVVTFSNGKVIRVQLVKGEDYKTLVYSANGWLNIS